MIEYGSQRIVVTYTKRRRASHLAVSLYRITLPAIQLIACISNQLCLGIIASGIGFVLAQRTPFQVRDIRRSFIFIQ